MSSYTVKSGDTLSEIAETYGFSVSELAELNDIKDVDFIKAGQVLDIPETKAPEVVQEASAVVQEEPTETTEQIGFDYKVYGKNSRRPY
jgi:LysM repeat protein